MKDCAKFVHISRLEMFSVSLAGYTISALLLIRKHLMESI